MHFLKPEPATNWCTCGMFFSPKPGFSPFPPLLISCFLYLLSKSFGWFLLSRFLSMRSDRSCLRTPVAYSISPCSAVMMREATLPLSRIEKDLCASNVRMKVNRKCFLVSSWPNNVRAFSTLAGTWRRRGRRWWRGRRIGRRRSVE